MDPPVQATTQGGQFWTPIGGQYSTPVDTSQSTRRSIITARHAEALRNSMPLGNFHLQCSRWQLGACTCTVAMAVAGPSAPEQVTEYAVVTEG